MQEIPIKAVLRQDVSKNTGKTYFFIEIELTPNCTKKVFLESAETELVKIAYIKKQQ